MANQDHQTYIYIGLAGEGDGTGEGGLMRLADGDDRWQTITSGLPEQPQVRALAVHPNDPAVIYAGTQLGPYRSDDRGEHWEALESPRPGMDVWSLAFHPNKSNVLFAGYEPCAIYRSEDGGVSWKQMDTSRVRFPDVTTYMPPLAKRVIGIAVDPSEPENVYASIEVGGLLASRDGGETWDSVTDGLYRENHTVDLHGVQVSPAAPGHVFIITQVAMFRSPDRGAHWEHVRFGEMFPGGSYCRGLTVAPDDPKTLYLAAGAGGGGAPSGTAEKGALFRSKDLADTWERVDIGEEPPSRMFQIAIDPRATEKVYCCTYDGHIYSSNDSGVSWKSGKMQTKLSRARHVYPMVCA
ncbi:MAG: hypothetical protein IH861_15960 [Chloroflexi bacterium]|nr:hypothetical protein [Chloroflexota bacterium]